MKNSLRLAFVVAVVLALAACSQVAPTAPSAGSGTLRTLDVASTSTFQASPAAAAYGVAQYEFSPSQFGFGVDTMAIQQLATQGVQGSQRGGAVINRIPTKTQVPFVAPQSASPQMLGAQALSSASQTFEGLNLLDQRAANNGNQFTVEPPDQGLCVGKGYVLEAVNDVLKVFTTDGQTALPTVDLNTFLGYAPAIVRSGPGGRPVFGPSVTDPSCIYDAGTRRWYLVTLTLATAPRTGALTGQNTLDVAVSTTDDPTGAWNIYHLNVTTDGQNCPCLGDYPHIGADASGFFITTNNFPLSGNSSPDNGVGYNGAWVYAFDKLGLASGENHVNVVSMPAVDSEGLVGYSVWPATSVGSAYPATTNGTEYFMSSTTVFSSSMHQIDVWGLDGTDSLHGHHPSLTLTSTRVDVAQYADPPETVPQKAGPVPLAQALNNDDFGYGPPPNGTTQVEGGIATNDSGMKQVVFAGGHLYGALTTAARNGGGAGGSYGAGVAWFDVTPSMGRHGVSASLAGNGTIAPMGVNFIFPTITVNGDGNGVIAVTAVGPNTYPSSAYIPFTASGGPGAPVRLHAGDGPQDGFTEYWLGGGRPRWGDYGAGAVDPGTGHIWIASEDIHQSCTYAEYWSDPANGSATCGGTRAPLGNWSTQVSEIVP